MRQERIRIRVTDKEKRWIQDAAEKKNLTVSEYIRRVSINPPEVTRKEYEDTIYELFYEIKKQGVNVNQIAKKYNEFGYMEQANEVMERMEHIDFIMEQIMKSTRK